MKKSAHDTEMQTTVKRQAEELEDLKQKIKQSKTDLDGEIKVIERQPDKVEDVKEKRKSFLDSVELKRQVDELQQEVQQLKKSRVKSRSPDKKEEVVATSSTDKPPPPDKHTPSKAKAKPSRKPVSPEAKSNERSTSEETVFYPEPEQRGRKRQPSKTKQETISELKESLPDVQKAKPKAKAKNEPNARSRTRSHHEVVLPTKDDGVVHIEDIVGDRHTSTSASENRRKREEGNIKRWKMLIKLLEQGKIHME